MAFLVTADISSSLEVGYNSAQVDRLLLSAEASLRSLGFVFEDVSATARSIEGASIGRSVFSITPVRTITSVRKLNEQGTLLSTLTEGTDYIVRKHPNINQYTTQIELLDNCLYAYNVIEVTGIWGIFIDFTAASNFEQKLLRAGIIEWVQSSLNINIGQSALEMNISKSKTGQSEVTYNNPDTALQLESITTDNNFSNILNYFYA